MTKAFMGIDYAGVPCVKMTKGNFDPATTPDSQRSAFLFSSKWAADLKLHTLETVTYERSGSADSIYQKRLPAGSTDGNYDLIKVSIVSGSEQVGIRNTRYPDLLYDLPLANLFTRRTSDDRFVQISRRVREGGSNKFGAEPKYWRSDAAGFVTWYRDYTDTGTTTGLRNLGNAALFGISPGYEKNLVIWNLPATNVPIKDATVKAPIAGQRVVEINSQRCRVAKPGYDVRTATPTQMAFDSSGRPASIIAADDISLPLGVKQIELGIAVPSDTVCDIFLYEDGILTFPLSPKNSTLEVEYWFSGTKLFINNTGSACRARFMVIAFDGRPPTDGPNDVFRQVTINGERVIQFLKPGAASSPRFADIILDSRWPCLQVLAEGYIPVAAQPNRTPSNANQGQSHVVNFDGDGMFPIVKYATVHSDENGVYVREPVTHIIENYNGSTIYQGGISTYCTITGNQAVFKTFKGNPTLETVNSDDTSFSYQYDNSIVGIRYYVLGIPQ
jgi:hypothetical protein